MSDSDNLLEMFIFENMQLLEQLEELLLGGEKNDGLNEEQINETFRVMHTIKGSSAMMEYEGMTTLAHAVEDVFAKIREKLPKESEWPRIFDLVLEAIDFFKEEIEKIQDGMQPDGDGEELCREMKQILERLKKDDLEGEEDSASIDMNFPVEEEVEELVESVELPLDKLNLEPGEACFKATVFFESGCQMETVRAFGVVMSVKDMCSSVVHYPEDLNDNCDEEIATKGLTIFMAAAENEKNDLREKLEQTMFLQSLDFTEVDISEKAQEKEADQQAHVERSASEEAPSKPAERKKAEKPAPQSADAKTDDKPVRQSFISVNVNKVDKLMNLVGEIVTTESMVTKNPDLADMQLENFDKQARLLRKLTDELQDVVMSIRMVPISATFHKMQRIVRDMCKKVGKQANLVIIGEETEVDKNIIDNLSDPLMHIIRNSMDHGIESPEERIAAGKNPVGTVRLEARNSGGDVIVQVADDGAGIDKDKVIQKAIEKGLTTKAENEISDKEAYNFILLPGFSTNDEVTEYSGRGVGMDVVHQNIDKIGGSVSVESEPGKGMTVTIHIPLTLAIMDGMKITVGDSIYIVPTLTIRESLEPRLHKIIQEPDGSEFIMIRGECFPILRLNRIFGVPAKVEELNDGIMVLVEGEAGAVCIFADKLLGEQQAVIKPMPPFISRYIGRVKGIGGCTIMGDGSIALILDINSLLSA